MHHWGYGCLTSETLFLSESGINFLLVLPSLFPKLVYSKEVALHSLNGDRATRMYLNAMTRFHRTDSLFVGSHKNFAVLTDTTTDPFYQAENKLSLF